MSYRTVLLYAAMGLAAGVTPAISSERARLAVEIAPIGAQAKIVPVANAGYPLAPGYHSGLGHEHIWVGGDYLRRGDNWIADRWDQRGDHWRSERGGWDRN